MTDEFGFQPPGDSAFTRKCRLHQSRYRCEVLKQPECGPYRPGGYLVGSSLANGEQTGANFLDDAARACAWEKLAEKRLFNRDLTVEKHRLFNNMLSSQPMCINLFACLRLGIHLGDPCAAQVVAAMFKGQPIRHIDRLEIEMLPQPKEDYISDKTAFDAALLFRTADRRPGLISIETKYTDKLGGNQGAAAKRQREIAHRMGLLSAAGRDWYASHSFDQVMRNLLLTLVYGQKHGFAVAINYIIAPSEDVATRQLVTDLRARLASAYQDSICFLSLEDLVARGRAVADARFRSHLDRFHKRYLAF